MDHPSTIKSTARPRRAYTQDRRALTRAATRERIVRATVDLHARHGALATSYAMIAARAGVAPQTVYNHFPTLGALLGGCTGHVMAQAPPVDAGCFGAARQSATRLRRLADAVYAQLEFVSPWLRLGWGEAEVVPELRAFFDGGRARLRGLVRDAVAADARATTDFVDAALLVLDYPGWKALRQQRSPAAAAALAGECLVALLDRLPQASAKDPP